MISKYKALWKPNQDAEKLSESDFDYDENKIEPSEELSVRIAEREKQKEDNMKIESSNHSSDLRRDYISLNSLMERLYFSPVVNENQLDSRQMVRGQPLENLFTFIPNHWDEDAEDKSRYSPANLQARTIL